MFTKLDHAIASKNTQEIKRCTEFLHTGQNTVLEEPEGGSSGSLRSERSEGGRSRSATSEESEPCSPNRRKIKRAQTIRKANKDRHMQALSQLAKHLENVKSLRQNQIKH